MMLLDGRFNRIIGTLLILAIVFNLIGLQPTQCASQEDLKSLINNFNSLSKEEQSVAAMEIFKNYKDYKELKPWEINRQAAQAIDDQMVDMTREIWREVSCKKGGIDYIVPVGTLGNRNGPESKYLPGKSDKDFIPMGSGAGDAADNFNKAFTKKFRLNPATLDINVLDPTKIETWPDRVKAFSNPEKYNTLGGNKWLQGNMYEKNPDVWLTHPLSGEIDEVTYRGMTYGKPPDLVPEDAAGFYSDNIRLRNRLKNLDPKTRMLKQSKYDLRNVEAFKTAGGTLTTADKQLVAAADKANNGLTKEAIEEYGKSLGLSGDAALERYFADMNSLTERMGKKCLAPLLEKASMGAMSGVAKIELGGVLANLPESMANKFGEELAKGTVNKQVWNEALMTASTLRSSSSTMSWLSNQLDSISKQRYGESYIWISNPERLAIHGAVEESADFASKLASLAKGGFIVAGAGFAGWAIYDAYQEGKKEGGSGLSQATGRAAIELIEAGCPAIGLGELIGRLTAMGVDWQISAFKDNQLDKLYDQYKSGKNLDDVLYDAEFKNSGSASALRQLAIEERKKNPGLSDSDIEAKVKAYLKDYLKLRLDTEKAVGQYEDLNARMESWVNKNEIPLEPGSDSVTARIDNSQLSKDEYEFLMAELM